MEMNYKELRPKYKNQKLVYDMNNVWLPSESSKNGFTIGDTVWHVNKESRFLTEFKTIKGLVSHYNKGSEVLADVSTRFTVGCHYSVVYMWKGMKIRTQGRLTSKTDTKIRMTDDKNVSHSIKLCDILNEC